MHSRWLTNVRAVALIGGVAIIAASILAPAATAQRREDWDSPSNPQRLDRINAGTYVTVRTTQSIVSNRTDGRIFSGVIAEDVWDDYGRLAVPAIPAGSRTELIVRTASDSDLILDLESIDAHGQRYAVSAVPERIESSHDARFGDDKTAEFVGGGALLGTVIGAIAGGGKGAAIRAATGAATGLGLAFRGRSVRVPAGALVTFRLDRALAIGMPDTGYNRDRSHYHRYPEASPLPQQRF